jgi:hypothetical protein
MVDCKFLHPKAVEDHVGLIPYWLSEDNPAPARQQLDDNYRHGGGWRPMRNFRLTPGNALRYPGDPPLLPLAEMHLRDELILVYEYGIVAIIQPDRSFEAARMD